MKSHIISIDDKNYLEKGQKTDNGIFDGITWIAMDGRPYSADNWDESVDLRNISSPIYGWFFEETKE